MIVIKDPAMMTVENTRAGYKALWLRLERTRLLLEGQYRRCCVRNVLRSWMPTVADLPPKADGTAWRYDDFVWNVCRLAEVEGYEQLPPPTLAPRRWREVLRAITALTLRVGMRGLDLRALDAAYGDAFPHGATLDVAKKGQPKTNERT